MGYVALGFEMCLGDVDRDRDVGEWVLMVVVIGG
jgi:hypothetical protein